MIADLVPAWLQDSLSMKAVQWIELILATPVALWDRASFVTLRLYRSHDETLSLTFELH